MIPLNSANILITGLARDCEKQIDASILALSNAFSAARSLAFLVIESDSSDKTIARLDNLSKKIANFEYLALGNLRQQRAKRTDRIAYCRNAYINIIASDPTYADYDYVVIADLDGVNNVLRADAVQSCWTSGEEWDVCCANQMGPYYDIWALRHPLWSPCDCWEQSRFLHTNGAGRFAAIYSSVYSRMLTIAPFSAWIDVDSAFGGCAIYTRAAITDVTYVGITATGYEVCEHVEVNRQIKRKGGRIVINPAFVNAGIVGNSWYATVLGALALWFRCLLPRPLEGLSDIKRHVEHNQQTD